VRKSLRNVGISLGLASLVAVTAVTASLAAPAQTVIVNPVPSTATPNIADGETDAITKVGNTVIVGGTFTSVSNRNDSTVIARNHLLAFDATTGLVSTTFAPNPDKEVEALLPGPAGTNTVYVGGRFQKVGGVPHPFLTLLDVTTGLPVPGFNPPALDDEVFTMAMYTTTQLIIGGVFTTVGTTARGGLASLDPNTGALTNYLNLPLAGHHNWDGTAATAMASVGATAMAIRPTSSQMIVLGNFKTIAGKDRDQIALLNLTPTTATVGNWETNVGKAKCNAASFDSWVRGVDYAPNGSDFVIVTTGGPYNGTPCDAVMKFSSTATGANMLPTWTDYTGGDTVLSVTSAGDAIYVGGHFRWLNNSTGHDGAVAGAVGRASIAALDPQTGLPLAWNPGRNPRGYGVTAMYSDGTGVYMGSDTSYIGNTDYARGKIAYFPIDGGVAPATNKAPTLPSYLYMSGSAVYIAPTLDRINVGGPTIPATDGGPDWLGDTQTATPNRVAVGSVLTWPNLPAHGTTATLPAYVPPAIFNSARQYPASASPAWTFPVPAGTTVNVNLYVAQRQWDNTNNVAQATTFSVLVNGVVKVASFDPNASIGYNTGGAMASIPVTSPASGVITIGFTNVNGQAIVNGIELVRTGGTATVQGISRRAFTGGVPSTTVTVLTQTDTTPFATAGRGAFSVDNKLFYGLSDGNFYMRTFNGTTLGDPVYVNPYTDPKWDSISTGAAAEGKVDTTYMGMKSSFYAEIPLIKSMFYTGGKLYYTRSDSTHLYWRWFTPDSGVVGADKFIVAGTSSLASSGGLLVVTSTKIYFSKTDGKLYTLVFNGTTVSGTPTLVTGSTGLTRPIIFIGP
jgi:hypothetical protein